MSDSPSDPTSRSDSSLDGTLRPDAIDPDDRARDDPDLEYLIRLQEAFAGDATRFETAHARGEGSSGLYERLLRVRRISLKLDNRIHVIRLQRRLRAG